MSGDETPRTAQCAFLGTKDSVARVRAWLRGVLEKFAIPESAGENAVLVASELATNAATHSRSSGPHGSYLVRLRRGVSRLRLEVTDAGGVAEPRARRNGTPHPDPLSGIALQEGGQGLALVEHFTTRWWVRGGLGGRTVGAEIALDGAQPSPAAPTDIPQDSIGE